MNVTVRFLSVALLIVVLVPASAVAQGFVGASVGTVFGTSFDDCGPIARCESRRQSLGFTVGALGRVFGTELEVTHTPKFFGESDVLTDQSVTTVTYSMLFKLPSGPIQPYGEIGVGVLNTSVDFSTDAFSSFRDSSFAWAFGAGLLAFPGQHIGVRAEIKYFRPTEEFEIPGLPAGSTTLSHARASVGLVARF